MTIQINGTSGISGVDGSAATPALQGSDTNTGISFGTDEVQLITGGTQRALVDSTGYLRLAGAGIQFNGDTAAANALDDYEEGTWTPEIVIASPTGGSISYNLQVGRYVKIGSFVHVQCHLNINTTTLTGGGAELGGLPFNFPSSNGARGGLTIHYAAGFFTGLTGYQITIRAEDNVPRGRFNYADAADLHVESEVPAANLTGGGIMVTGMYRVS